MTKISTLTPEQTLVYKTLLELGTDTVQHVADKTRLPRTTCYLLLNQLKILGLVSETVIGKKTYLTANDPHKLYMLIEEKVAELQTMAETTSNQLPELMALYNQSPHKPVVRFFEGWQGIKAILEESLRADEILVMCSGYEQPLHPPLKEYIYDKYMAEVTNLNITMREIVTPDVDHLEYIERFYSDTHQILVSQQQPSNHHLDKLIFGNKVAFVAYDALNGTIIDHPQIATFEKSVFEQLWNGIGEQVKE
ncbi:MAG TPA: helix-turn-helix domain-containing protein [Vitreimonas sp.]|nr:helix-turn-helix domain-containing protein [Vitreimonas sp.]